MKEAPNLVYRNGWSQLDPTEPGTYHRCNSTPWDDIGAYSVKVEMIQGELCVTEETDFCETIKGVAPLWGHCIDEYEPEYHQDFIICFWKLAKPGEPLMDHDDAVRQLASSGAFDNRFERGQSQCFDCGTVADYFKDSVSEDRWCLCRNSRCENHKGAWTPHGVFKTLLEQLNQAIDDAEGNVSSGDPG